MHEVAGFSGVYLLYSLNPKCRGNTYIGFTVNPERRIGQHNKGHQGGGARRTSGRGPWEMVLIIHGFPNQIAALRFEWAWQNPKKSRRLRHLPAKKKNENRFQFAIRIVANMLRTGPWNRLPLTIRWLKQEYFEDFPPGCSAPLHMPIVYGPVHALDSAGRDTQAGTQLQEEEHLPDIVTRICEVCRIKIKDGDCTLRCLHASCAMESHIRCLAKKFSPHSILPIEGQCPRCNMDLLWGDLVRFKAGCYKNIQMGDDDED